MPEKFDAGCGDCCKPGADVCLYACCCPCFAYKEVSDNIAPPGQGGFNGWMYCLLTYPLGLGLCVLCIVGDEVAKKRGIEQGGIVCSFAKACCDCCVCYSCSVLHESRLYKEQMAGGNGVKTVEMDRK